MNKAEFEKCHQWAEKEGGFNNDCITRYLPKSMILEIQYRGINFKLYRMKGTRKTALLHDYELKEVRSYRHFLSALKAWVSRIEKKEGIRAVMW